VRLSYNSWMNDNSVPPPIPISGLKLGTTAIRDELHFTGGLRALRLEGGWVIGPVLREGVVQFTGFIPEERLASVGHSVGALLFGADQISGTDCHLPVRVWRPLLGPPILKHSADDTWGMIALAARRTNDVGYARLASNLSVSLRAAGLQLRNASDEYHKQIQAALASGKKVGLRFCNIPMIDLHLAFHSVLMEMASARDYLAQVAARRVNAPDQRDSLGRLRGWLDKPANSAALSDELVARLLAASDAKGPDPWLADITEYRNLFLHREHIGAVAKWLALEECDSAFGPVRTVRMAIHIRPGAEVMCDALVRFVMLYGELCRLADFAATLAPYAAVPLNFVHLDE
jgi:hypothetical protein